MILPPVLAATLVFLFGFLAGYAMIRLGRNKPLAAWEPKALRPLALVLMSASFTLALGLLAWGLLGAGSAG